MFALSTCPIRLATAPVNAPFSCPNSSLSTRFSGIAAQFKVINGLLFLSLNETIALATISLPVPEAPRRSTVASLAATCLINAYISRMLLQLPINAGGLLSSSISLNCLFSCISCSFSLCSAITAISASPTIFPTISKNFKSFCKSAFSSITLSTLKVPITLSILIIGTHINAIFSSLSLAPSLFKNLGS